MVEVRRKRNESIDRLLYRFKKAFNNSGITHDLKRIKHFQKPSEVKNVCNEKIKFRNKKNREQRIAKIREKRRLKRITVCW